MRTPCTLRMQRVGRRRLGEGMQPRGWLCLTTSMNTSAFRRSRALTAADEGTKLARPRLLFARGQRWLESASMRVQRSLFAKMSRCQREDAGLQPTTPSASAESRLRSKISAAATTREVRRGCGRSTDAGTTGGHRSWERASLRELPSAAPGYILQV